MTEWWSEGELRAYLDGEAAPEELERAAAHLGECAECSRLLAELQARSVWVGSLMDELTAAGTPKRAGHRRRWRTVTAVSAVAAALAAGLAVAMLLSPRQVAPRAQQTPPPVTRTAEPPMAVAVAAPPVFEAPVRRPVPRKRAVRPTLPNDGFVALDDEPFETGVVFRVALGPAEVPADIVFGSDGRARAIRLVQYK